MLGLADYLQVIVPALPRLPVALIGLAAASAIAVLSIKRGAQVTGAFLAVEMLGLAILTGSAFLHPWHGVAAAVLHPVVASAVGAGGRMALVPLDSSGFALAVATSVFTCGGATWVLYFAEEMIEPEQRIGRVVTLVSPLAAITIGLPLALAVLAAPDRAAMLASDTPLATFLAQAGGPALARLVAGGIVLAVFNAVVASNMGYARLIYATARDGMWPAAIGAPLARISPRFGSPLVATLALAVVSAMAMLLSERMLLILNANENVLEYTLLGLAVIIGRRRGQTGYHYRVRPYPAIAILALLTGPALGVADWFDPDAGRPSLFVLAGMIAFSLLYQPLIRRRRSRTILST
jgi:amino acid transporter